MDDNSITSGKTSNTVSAHAGRPSISTGGTGSGLHIRGKSEIGDYVFEDKLSIRMFKNQGKAFASPLEINAI